MKQRKWRKSLNTFLAASLVAGIVVPVVPSAVNAETVASDLIISEYIEGNSFNKALELYNGTGATVDLSDYTLELYSNGASTPTQKVTLSGNLANGSTFVLYNSQAAEEIINKGDLESSAVVNFNGDDAIVLKKSGTVIDSFGQVGVDPGNAWGTDVKTIDSTLVRKSSITSGDTNLYNSFDPAVEWASYPINTFSYLGSHVMDGVTNPIETKVKAVTASPKSSLVSVGTKVTLSTSTVGATIYYTLDGSTPTTNSLIYNEPITIAKDTTIKTLAVKSGLTNSDVSEFNYFIPNENLQIHDIQGESHYSKYDGQYVSDIDGIVTYVNGNEFYMQDLQPDHNDKTSEGILVYKRSHGVEVGDVVSVSGQVKEWVLEGYSEKLQTDLPVTEINATEVVEIANDQKLPEPIVIGKDRILPTEIIDNDRFTIFDPAQDGIDFFESLEGMLVQVDDAKVVALQQYGELTVIPGTLPTNTTAGGLRISEHDYNPERIMVDINDENYIAKMGDRFDGSITGVVSYGYSNYKVFSHKEDLPTLIEGSNKRETTTIKPDEDELTIASYNVENFSTKTSATKVTKLAEAIVSNMKSPDIIGLTEVQDNDGSTDSGTVDASQSAKVLIDKIVSLGGPEYVYTDIAPENKEDGGAPGGNIRVGFLYNPERVKLTEGTKGTATQAVDFENGKLTLNPGRIDPTNDAFDDSRKPLAAQFEFNGESVIVVANHFNSKGGDQPLFGKHQPPVLSSEVQRLEIAGIVNGFVSDVLDEDPDANIVLVGDFNDFEFSNPLKTLKGNDLTNMIEKVQAGERYTYSYQGNAQVLDHILVANHLASNTEVDIVHINSGFMEEHGRASDHDPVLVQIDFEEEDKEEPGKPEKPGKPNKPGKPGKSDKFDKVYEYKNLKKKQLVIPQRNVKLSLDAKSKVDLVWLKGQYVDLSGEGFKNTTVKFEPKKSGGILELNGTKVNKIIIGPNVTEIRGAAKGQEFEYLKGADEDEIEFD